MVKIKKGHEICIVPETAYRELYADKGWELINEPADPKAVSEAAPNARKGRRRGADKNDPDRGGA